MKANTIYYNFCLIHFFKFLTIFEVLRYGRVKFSKKPSYHTLPATSIVLFGMKNSLHVNLGPNLPTYQFSFKSVQPYSYRNINYPLSTSISRDLSFWSIIEDKQPITASPQESFLIDTPPWYDIEEYEFQLFLLLQGVLVFSCTST